MNYLVPTKFYLFQNYPNPFTEKTTIKYCMAYKTKVRITIYDSEGEMIERLVDGVKEAGTYEVKFYVSDLENGGNRVLGIRHRVPNSPYPVSGNQHLASGTYFYQMKAGDYLSEKEMIINQKENKSVQSK